MQSSKSINRKISFKTIKMGKTIPDRWLDYSKIGNLVEGTQFIPFKVPLHQRICENLPERARHTTHDIIEALPNVGLVINLTNTQKGTKYYEPNDWKSQGIDYKWIKVEGHVTPSQHLLVQFCHTVKQFLDTNPSKLIGIHCTHGLNRTGYFVCSYMVLVLSIPPNEAIKRFAEARGYEIERENYISSIKLHDSNSNLKQTANTLPVLIPKTQLAIKRSNQTEIDDERYDDRKRRNFNSDAFSKSDAEHSQTYNHGSLRNFLPDTSSPSIRRNDGRFRYTNDYRDRRYYRGSERMNGTSNDRRVRRDSSHRPRKDEYAHKYRESYNSQTSSSNSRLNEGSNRRRSRWDNN
ncbi:RNA/RNP complex-1-interacting phosphatase homolog [Chironomus tepperi]|uniref:RNA/RNP complex-1-interacting phosphatase homolog n=1 Tax=Chironomus tepperi TaxID=113505 RepID=UPI00391FA68C